MKTFSWVYQDRVTGELVLVMKPHRRSVNGLYGVLTVTQRSNGLGSYLADVHTYMAASTFRPRYQYISRLKPTQDLTKPKMTYFEKAKAGDKVISNSFIVPINNKYAFKHHQRQMLESVKLTAKELGVKALLHCIEIDTCRSSKFVPAGYKKYRFDFVGRVK